MARKNDNAGGSKKATKAQKAERKRDVPSKVVEDRKDIPQQDPSDPEVIRRKRQFDAKRKQEAVRAREEQLAEAARPGDHPDVVVSVKATERAARAEQERIDEGKRAAAKQQPFQPPAKPGDDGFNPEPAHPEKPGPLGSAPRSPGTPDGPQDEDVIYVTDDIAADGTPNVSEGFVEQMPEYDGESDRLYTDANPYWRHMIAEQAGPVGEDGELEPVINSHSEEGARLDEIKLQRPVQYVPNDATLDPVSNNPDRREAQEARRAKRAMCRLLPRRVWT